MKTKLSILVFLLSSATLFSQVTLDANGAGNTYEEITAVLAPGDNPIETPDCNHTTFGRHIDEIFDADLNTNVFRFFIHTSPDNDRCINFDRQRNEIKTYDQSPDNLLGVENETVAYKWKFKLDTDLQVSSSFTHIHQLKSVGGSLASMPMYTLTLRKSSPDRLELRYADTDSQVTLKQTDLAPFKGAWVEVTETVEYGTSGTYDIEIKKVSDGAVLFNYTNNAIINWRPSADFVRPKWGIYRSLNAASDLRDEEVLFANFSIEELSTLSNNDFILKNDDIKLFPNPANEQVAITETELNSYTSFAIFNQLGQLIVKETTDSKVINVSKLSNGLYMIVFSKDNSRVAVKKLLVN